MNRSVLLDLRRHGNFHPGYGAPMNENATGVPYEEEMERRRRRDAAFVERLRTLYGRPYPFTGGP